MASQTNNTGWKMEQGDRKGGVDARDGMHGD